MQIRICDGRRRIDTMFGSRTSLSRGGVLAALLSVAGVGAGAGACAGGAHRRFRIIFQ